MNSEHNNAAKLTLDADTVINAIEQLLDPPVDKKTAIFLDEQRKINEAKTPKRRFSVMRGRLIYVCPSCGRRVHQFKERCGACGQKLEWDIRVVKD